MTTSRAGVWLLAARPATLTAALAPVAVGCALAVRDGHFRALPAAATLLAALLIQIGTNFVNDVADFERGADTEERLGPVRVTQSGLISAAQVRRAAILTFAAAGLLGLYLVAIAGWPILLVGVASILSGVAYTAGPWPLGYRGLGDVFVFLFFGIVAVTGTYYVQAGALSGTALALSIPVGALATAILVVNNVRDAATDVLAGKRTLAVRFGTGFGLAEFYALVASAYLVPALLWLGGAASAWIFLPWITLPSGWRLLRGLAACSTGPAFNDALRATAKLHGIFSLLLAVGVALGG